MLFLLLVNYCFILFLVFLFVWSNSPLKMTWALFSKPVAAFSKGRFSKFPFLISSYKSDKLGLLGTCTLKGLRQSPKSPVASRCAKSYLFSVELNFWILEHKKLLREKAISDQQNKTSLWILLGNGTWSLYCWGFFNYDNSDLEPIKSKLLLWTLWLSSPLYCIISYLFRNLFDSVTMKRNKK